jgi:dTDP-4-dehydrorhamnose reductase
LPIASIIFRLKDNKPVVLITGSGGQLGQSFRLVQNSYSQYQWIFADKQTLPVEDAVAVADFFARNKIDYCINCAAYTAVDKAETETDAALATNTDAAGYLAAACKEYGAVCIHISTDYVFNGQGTIPYKETDAVSPVNAYGISKLKGEVLIAATNPEAIIIRTSWLYSPFGHNFVKTMLRLMATKESISVVNDQLGKPTYAPDLAAAIMQIISAGNFKGGVYHFSNSGNPISWFDFAIAIKECVQSNCQVHPINTMAYPTPAKRPAYSVLDTSLIQQQYSLDIPHWKNSLTACLRLLSESHL